MRLSGISDKKWFSWVLVSVLLVSNIISFRMADSYFSGMSPADDDEVKVESSVLGSGSRIIDLAEDILRFFRNP